MPRWQVSGEPYGPASDAWSVGLLAHEILTLRHPFVGGSLAALMQRILHCQYDTKLLDESPYPEELRLVASRDGLLHVDPTKRLQLEEMLARPAFQVE